MKPRTWRVFAPLAIASFTWNSFAWGQIATNATCKDEFSWMNNDKGQSPCLVAAYLQSVCSGGKFFVPALDFSLFPDQPESQVGYNGPNQDNTNPCTCADATYNLLSGCANCQGGGADSFTRWSSACESERLVDHSTSFSQNVPGDTSISHWAEQNPAQWPNGKFDLAAAEKLAEEGSSSSSTSSDQSTSSTGDQPPPTDSNQSNPEKQSSSVGPIVGGVVGGVLGLTLIAVLIFWILRQNRQHKTAVGDSEAKPMMVPATFGNGPLTSSGNPPTTAFPSYLSPTPATTATATSDRYYSSIDRSLLYTPPQAALTPPIPSETPLNGTFSTPSRFMLGQRSNGSMETVTTAGPPVHPHSHQHLLHTPHSSISGQPQTHFLTPILPEQARINAPRPEATYPVLAHSIELVSGERDRQGRSTSESAPTSVTATPPRRINPPMYTNDGSNNNNNNNAQSSQTTEIALGNSLMLDNNAAQTNVQEETETETITPSSFGPPPYLASHAERRRALGISTATVASSNVLGPPSPSEPVPPLPQILEGSDVNQGPWPREKS